MNVELRHPKDLKRLCERGRGEHSARQRDHYRAVLLASEGQSTEAIKGLSADGCQADRI